MPRDLRRRIRFSRVKISSCLLFVSSCWSPPRGPSTITHCRRLTLAGATSSPIRRRRWRQRVLVEAAGVNKQPLCKPHGRTEHATATTQRAHKETRSSKATNRYRPITGVPRGVCDQNRSPARSFWVKYLNLDRADKHLCGSRSLF